MREFLFLYFIVLFSVSCNERVEAGDNEVESGDIYFNYSITGEEDGVVACFLQLHEKSPRGHTIMLEAPAEIKINNEILQPETSAIMGAYYELVKPVEDFTGRHTITFTDNNGKKFNESFKFVPFSFAQSIPQKVTRGSIEWELKDFDSSVTHLRVVLTDTSFSSPDVNELIYVHNNKIRIDSSLLSRVVNGPINMEVIKEYDRSIIRGADEIGRLQVNYSLRREFLLIGARRK